MIDYTKSAELNNMGTDEMVAYFIKYPKSHRRAISICEVCDKERESDFVSARDLCQSCAGAKRFSSPESREEVSKRQKAYWTQFHRDKQSMLKIRFHEEHPEARVAHSKRMIEYNKIHPEKLESLAKACQEYWVNPVHRYEQSQRRIKYFKEHPNAGAEQGARLLDSDAHKASVDNQIGGHDIVNHHFIYDHAHPDNHVVEMTRSEHTSHHNWMRRAGLEVPHINSELPIYSEQSA